jgi:hypothetical protein
MRHGRRVIEAVLFWLLASCIMYISVVTILSRIIV